MSTFADDEEGVDDATKLQISKHFLLSSPPGQFQEVLKDVKTLVGTSLVSESLCEETAKSYNNRNNRIVKAPSGSNVTLSVAGEVDKSHQIDPTNGSVFKVNHLDMTTSEGGEEAPASNADTSLELKQAALQTDISAYVTGRYVCESCSGCAYAKDGKMVVVITGENPNLRNFWAGKWNSVFTITDISTSSAQISGEIKVHAHYFEDGNVQLQTQKPIAASEIKYTNEKEFAEAVVKLITSEEQVLQEGLGRMYASMDTEIVKEIRRIMPVTKQRMNWNINAVNFTNQLQGKGNSAP